MAALDWKPAVDANAFNAALTHAAATFEADYQCDYAYHAQMEPLNAVASVSPAGDSVEIWCGAQSQTIACETPAKLLGILREKVKLNDMLLGGAFGRRGNRDADFILDAVFLSKIAGRPVKVIWMREDDVRNGKFRPMSAHHLRAGVDSNGKLVAWHHRVAVDRVKPAFDLVRYQLGEARDTIAMRGADPIDYVVPNTWIEQLYRDTGVRTAPLRGIGFNANKFATESFLDEIVLKRGGDPIAYRLDMMTDARAIDVIKKVKEMADWERPRDGRALGFAYAEYGQIKHNTKSAGIAEVSLNARTGEIKVHEFWCAVDCGIVVQPDNVVSQIEGDVIHGLGLALTETISIKGGVVKQSNFDDYRIPRMNEIPEIHVAVMPSGPDRVPQPGVGQVATPLVAPTIANAVARLANVRLRHTPFTTDRVLKAISETH
jgi:isoquinoline 1-oxidoreductase beta subunit